MGEPVRSRKAVLADKHRTALVARLSSLDHRRLLYLHEAAASGSVRPPPSASTPAPPS